jgi:hypothetical protein
MTEPATKTERDNGITSAPSTPSDAHTHHEASHDDTDHSHRAPQQRPKQEANLPGQGAGPQANSPQHAGHEQVAPRRPYNDTQSAGQPTALGRAIPAGQGRLPNGLPRFVVPWLVLGGCLGLVLAIVAAIAIVVMWRSTSFPATISVAGRILNQDQVTALLAKADHTFRRDAVQQRAALTDASRCFVAFRGDDRNHALDTLWCGPARTFDTIGNRTWTTMALHPTGGYFDDRPSGEASGSGVEPEAADFALVERPPHLVLLRPDGAQPGDGTNLVAERPPAERAGIVQLISSTDINPQRMHAPSGDGLLLGPQTAAKVAAVGATPVYGHGPDARSAAPGEQFLIIQFGPAPAFTNIVVSADADPGQLSRRYLTTPTAAILVGTARYPLPNINFASVNHDSTLLVSAPTNVPVYYELTDQGRTQRIDVRTGGRVPAAEFGPLYRSRNYAVIDRRLTASLTPLDGGDPVRFHLRLTGAALVPYDPDRGYAPAGLVWLAITIGEADTDGTAIGVPKFAVDAFTVTPAGAHPVNAVQHTLVAFPDRLLAAVPPNTTQAALTCRWTGEIAFIGTKAARPSAEQTVSITIPAS